MTKKSTVTVYGRKHIHDYVKKLAKWNKDENPDHSIALEYDNILIAGIKALYDQDIELNPAKNDE